MASTFSNPPQTSGSPERSQTKDYDDDVYSSSSHESHASLRKPLSSFDDEDLDLEDGFERPHKAKSWWSWKDIMTVRARRKASLGVEGYRDLNSHATRLLEDVYAARRRRKRNWYNYCIFSGIMLSFSS
jgi:hypothetical protein